MTNAVAPILANVIAAALARRGVPSAASAAQEAAEALIANPETRNQLNAESPAQSRVVWGSGAAVLGAAAIIWQQIETRQFDPATAGPAIAILLGAAYALYGRLKAGLKPLFSRKG